MDARRCLGYSYSRLVRIWPCPSYAQADAALLRNAFLGSMLALALYKGAVAGHTLLLTTVQFGSAADKIYVTVCAACLGDLVSAKATHGFGLVVGWL